MGRSFFTVFTLQLCHVTMTFAVIILNSLHTNKQHSHIFNFCKHETTVQFRFERFPFVLALRQAVVSC